jgi:hypothetical protein
MTIVLQLADSSIDFLEGMLDDIIVCVDSWEYPIDFIVLSAINNLNGYPLIWAGLD